MNRTLSRRYIAAKSQRGMMLLEGLIAILIFSLGILAMVGMQAVAIGHTSQAKHRIDATFVANKLIGRIWADKGNRGNYAGTIVGGVISGGTGFTVWGNSDFKPNMPKDALSSATVVIATFTPAPVSPQVPPPPIPLSGHQVTVTIKWRLPNEPATAPDHVYVATAEIVS